MIPWREKQQMCTTGRAGRGGEGEGSGSDDQSPGIFLYISYSSALFSSRFSWANVSLSKTPICVLSPVDAGDSSSFFRAWFSYHFPERIPVEPTLSKSQL